MEIASTSTAARKNDVYAFTPLNIRRLFSESVESEYRAHS